MDIGILGPLGPEDEPGQVLGQIRSPDTMVVLDLERFTKQRNEGSQPHAIGDVHRRTLDLRSAGEDRVYPVPTHPQVLFRAWPPRINSPSRFVPKSHARNPGIDGGIQHLRQWIMKVRARTYRAPIIDDGKSITAFLEGDSGISENGLPVLVIGSYKDLEPRQLQVIEEVGGILVEKPVGYEQQNLYGQRLLLLDACRNLNLGFGGSEDPPRALEAPSLRSLAAQARHRNPSEASNYTLNPNPTGEGAMRIYIDPPLQWSPESVDVLMKRIHGSTEAWQEDD